MSKSESMKPNPKKYHIGLFLAINAILSIPGFSQAPADTIGIIKEARNLTITKSDEKTKIYAEYVGEDGKESFFYYAIDHIIHEEECDDSDTGWNISLPYYMTEAENGCKNNGSGIKRYLIGADHIYAGWRFNYYDKGKIKNSFETGIRNLVGIGWQRKDKGPLFSVGVGFGIRRFNSKEGYAYNKKNDRLTLDPFSLEGEKRSSYLDLYTVHIPFIMRQRVGRYFAFTAGVSLNLNVYASASTLGEFNSISERIDYIGLQQRFVTTDIFASINLFGVGVYASWNPIGMFQSSFGPMVKGWSIGIDIISM